MYLEAVEYLPEKFNEIVGLISNKEIRVRIPVEELDMMLEPIKSKNDETRINEDEVDNEIKEDDHNVVDMVVSEDDSTSNSDDD